jgi:hypothetical protein
MSIRGGGWRISILAALALLVAAMIYAAAPRRADLTAFDPDIMGAQETLMWRHYYDKRYGALARDLYDAARQQQGFSPLDSLRIAIAAARAAHAFQPSKSQEEAERALPALETYFGLLAAAAPVKVDVPEAARTELAWWQARRLSVAPEEYGLMIARVSTLIYGVDNVDIRHAGVIRAIAMAYRDRHGDSMTEEDWTTVRDGLRRSYGLLKKGLQAR